MTQITETPAMSGLRVLDIAHRIVSELGTWQYHPALNIAVHMSVGPAPQVVVTLNRTDTDAATRRAFLDDMAVLVGCDARTHRNEAGVLSVLVGDDWRGTGVQVYSAGFVTEVSR